MNIKFLKENEMARALVGILLEKRTVDVPHELTRVQFLEVYKLFV